MRRLRHRHRIFVRSQNTICDFDRLLYRSPYCFYASSIAFGGSSASVGRVATDKRRTPGRFYFDMHPSVLPLRGNLLDVKRALVRVFNVFIVVRLFRRLYRRRSSTFIPLYARCSTFSL
jgi:hypothetical protein